MYSSATTGRPPHDRKAANAIPGKTALPVRSLLLLGANVARQGYHARRISRYAAIEAVRALFPHDNFVSSWPGMPAYAATGDPAFCHGTGAGRIASATCQHLGARGRVDFAGDDLPGVRDGAIAELRHLARLQRTFRSFPRKRESRANSQSKHCAECSPGRENASGGMAKVRTAARHSYGCLTPTA